MYRLDGGRGRLSSTVGVGPRFMRVVSTRRGCFREGDPRAFLWLREQVRGGRRGREPGHVAAAPCAASPLAAARLAQAVFRKYRYT